MLRSSLFRKATSSLKKSQRGCNLQLFRLITTDSPAKQLMMDSRSSNIPTTASVFDQDVGELFKSDRLVERNEHFSKTFEEEKLKLAKLEMFNPPSSFANYNNSLFSEVNNNTNSFSSLENFIDNSNEDFQFDNLKENNYSINSKIANEILDELKSSLNDNPYKIFPEMNEKNQKMLILTLKPTIDYINSIPTDFELIEFINEKIIKPIDSIEIQSIKTEEELNDIIKKQCETFENNYKNDINLIENPIINQFSLPILLKSGLKSLGNNYEYFNSMDFLSILNNLKKNKNRDFRVFVGLTDSFNYLIKKIWKDNFDLNLIQNLLRQMVICSVQTNEKTFSIIKDIIKQANDLLTNNDKRLNEDFLEGRTLQEILSEEINPDINDLLLSNDDIKSDVWNREDAKNLEKIDEKLHHFTKQFYQNKQI